MNRRLFRGIVLMFILALALTVMTKLARAESSTGVSQAQAGLMIRIVVAPTLNVLESTPVEGGYQMRVFTNQRSAQLNGQTIYFTKVGEQTVFVPTSSSSSDGLHYVTQVQP
jgi:hypothetical protein